MSAPRPVNVRNHDTCRVIPIAGNINPIRIRTDRSINNDFLPDNTFHRDFADNTFRDNSFNRDFFNHTLDDGFSNRPIGRRDRFGYRLGLRRFHDLCEVAAQTNRTRPVRTSGPKKDCCDND
ncbi:MAG: hypothetical protein ABIH23_00360 [bacterium]